MNQKRKKSFLTSKFIDSPRQCQEVTRKKCIARLCLQWKLRHPVLQFKVRFKLLNWVCSLISSDRLTRLKKCNNFARWRIAKRHSPSPSIIVLAVLLAVKLWTEHKFNVSSKLSMGRTSRLKCSRWTKASRPSHSFSRSITSWGLKWAIILSKAWFMLNFEFYSVRWCKNSTKIMIQKNFSLFSFGFLQRS